jgi:protocatechuate 3,4-dioxygenase beta subunit
MTTNPCDGDLTRRRFLERAGALGAAAAIGGAAAGTARAARTIDTALRLTPEQEEGPFYVALERVRRDITEGRPGVPLLLAIRVVTTAGAPIAKAACDIWHCDALGVYSDEASNGTSGQTWLRGVQLTGSDGIARFRTIYPGHYQGRTTHVHVKVHVGGTVSGRAYTGGHVSHTGQLLFADAVSTKVFALAPYTRDAQQRVLNGQDHVYTEQGGVRALLRLAALGTTARAGYRGSITLVVDPGSTPAAIGVGG